MFFRSGFQLTNLKPTEAPDPVVRGLLRLPDGKYPLIVDTWLREYISAGDRRTDQFNEPGEKMT